MTNIRRILTGAVLTLAASGLASADSIVSFTGTLPSQRTDITSPTSIAVQGFMPGSAGIPVGAVLQSLSFQVTEDITGTVAVQNNSPNADNISATIQTTGTFLTPAGNNVLPSNPLAQQTVTFTAVPGNGGTAGPQAYSGTITVKVANFPSTNAGCGAAGPCPINNGNDPSDFASFNNVNTANFTVTTSTFQGESGAGGNVILTVANNVDAAVTVFYDYIVPAPPSGTPEPATMILFGSGLVGLGLLRKRIKS